MFNCTQASEFGPLQVSCKVQNHRPNYVIKHWLHKATDVREYLSVSMSTEGQKSLDINVLVQNMQQKKVNYGPIT